LGARGSLGTALASHSRHSQRHFYNTHFHIYNTHFHLHLYYFQPTMATTLSSGIASAVPSVGRSAAASAATQSMAELGIASIIGAGCVQREFLPPATIKALSKATFAILLPMFLCTSIIQSVSKYGLKRSSLAVPLLAIVQSTCLFLASKLILLPLAGIDADSDDGRATTVCCSFGNSGVVPLIFCESLFRQSANSDYVAQSTAFVSLFLIGWSVSTSLSFVLIYLLVLLIVVKAHFVQSQPFSSLALLLELWAVSTYTG
jgi:hypothetical protein